MHMCMHMYMLECVSGAAPLLPLPFRSPSAHPCSPSLVYLLWLSCLFSSLFLLYPFTTPSLPLCTSSPQVRLTFLFSRMLIVDETSLQGRIKTLQLGFEDFLEVVVRTAASFTYLLTYLLTLLLTYLLEVVVRTAASFTLLACLLTYSLARPFSSISCENAFSRARRGLASYLLLAQRELTTGLVLTGALTFCVARKEAPPLLLEWPSMDADTPTT